MLSFIGRSAIQKIITLFFVSIVSFLIIHLAPGEPSEVDPTNPRMKAEDVARIRAAFHLDDPVHVQYAYWICDLATGELRSFKDGQPVLAKIFDRFLNSLPLFAVATLLVWTLSFPTGIHAAIRRGSVFDRGSTFVAYALISVPGFFLAYLIIMFVVNQLGAPVIGMRTFGTEQASVWFQIMDRIWHLTIPACLSALGGIAILSRYVRAQMLEVIGQDYVRTARAKGLGEEQVVYKHALRNAVLPVVTLAGLQFGGLLSGAVLVESVFNWPGLGTLAFDSILRRDFPTVLGILLFSSVLVIIANLITDFCYQLIDPRIKVGA